MTDVLRYLVIEKGIDINPVDKVAFLGYFARCLENLFLEGKDTLIAHMS